MNLAEMMKENDIGLEWLFTLSKLKDKEGLLFFEPVIETLEDDSEVSNLAPKCFLIDDGKFVYSEEMDNDIIINVIDHVISFTRIDGIQLNINTNEIKGFPFKFDQFRDQVFKAKTPEVPKDHVEIEFFHLKIGIKLWVVGMKHVGFRVKVLVKVTK